MTDAAEERDGLSESEERVVSGSRGTGSRGTPMSAETVELEPSPAEAPAARDGADPAEAPRELARGASVGRYLVLSLLGRGGMGEVYAAYDPELDRRVALKLLHATRRSESARKRLVREARALGKLSHPNVVQVHDVGEHEGDVFVAMELVEGQSLDVWCRGEPRPAWREVLAAYLDAARGLAAAHAKGLVHRDVKPSNLLRGGDGRVRVVDFGLAAGRGDVEPDDGSDTDPDEGRPANEEPLTAPNAVLGTPRYMAPEQHLGPRVTASCDQYGLCASLHEGLYGVPPFRVERTPGDTLATVGAALLARKQKGPAPAPPAGAPVPAWIYRALARGLAADPADRYPSVQALITALSDDPEARRAGRRRTAIGVVAATALAAVAAVGWARTGAFRDPCAHPEQALAGVWDDGARARVKAAFLGTGRPYAEDTAARVTAILDRHAASQAAMRGEVCQVSRRDPSRHELTGLRDLCLERRLGQLQALAAVLAEKPDPQVLDKAVQAAAGLPAVADCADAEALTARVRPPEDPALRARVAGLRPRADRLEALQVAARYPEALALGEELLAEVKDLPYAPLRAQVQYRMGRLRDEASSDYGAAKALLREAARSAAEGRDDVVASAAVARLLLVVGDREQRFEEAAVIRALGPVVIARARDARAEGEWLDAEGALLERMGKPAEALAAYERAVALKERALGPDHPDVGTSLSNMGLALRMAGQHARALAAHERALAIKEKALGPDHPDVALMLNNLAILLYRMADYPRSLATHERALAIRERALGPDHPSVGQSLNNLAALLNDMGEYTRAIPMAERSLAIKEKTLGREHPLVAHSLNNLGTTYSAMGDYPRALVMHRRALALREKALGAGHVDVAVSLVNLGNVHMLTGEVTAALSELERSLSIWEKALGPDHPDVAYALVGVGRARVRLGQPDAALPVLERARRIREKAWGASHPEDAELFLALGELDLARKRPESAAPLLERALGLKDPERTREIQITLADALFQIGHDRARARALVEEARAAADRVGHRPDLDRATRWLADHPR